MPRIEAEPVSSHRLGPPLSLRESTDAHGSQGPKISLYSTAAVSKCYIRCYNSPFSIPCPCLTQVLHHLSLSRRFFPFPPLPPTRCLSGLLLPKPSSHLSRTPLKRRKWYAQYARSQLHLDDDAGFGRPPGRDCAARERCECCHFSWTLRLREARVGTLGHGSQGSEIW